MPEANDHHAVLLLRETKRRGVDEKPGRRAAIAPPARSRRPAASSRRPAARAPSRWPGPRRIHGAGEAAGRTWRALGALHARRDGAGSRGERGGEARAPARALRRRAAARDPIRERSDATRTARPRRPAMCGAGRGAGGDRSAARAGRGGGAKREAAGGAAEEGRGKRDGAVGDGERGWWNVQTSLSAERARTRPVEVEHGANATEGGGRGSGIGKRAPGGRAGSSMVARGPRRDLPKPRTEASSPTLPALATPARSGRSKAAATGAKREAERERRWAIVGGTGKGEGTRGWGVRRPAGSAPRTRARVRACTGFSLRAADARSAPALPGEPAAPPPRPPRASSARPRCPPAPTASSRVLSRPARGILSRHPSHSRVNTLVTRVCARSAERSPTSPWGLLPPFFLPPSVSSPLSPPPPPSLLLPASLTRRPPRRAWPLPSWP